MIELVVGFNKYRAQVGTFSSDCENFAKLTALLSSVSAVVSIYNTLLDIQLEIKFLDLPRDIPAPAGGRPAPLAVGRATRGRREEGVSIKYALQSQYHRDRWVHPCQPNL